MKKYELAIMNIPKNRESIRSIPIGDCTKDIPFMLYIRFHEVCLEMHQCERERETSLMIL